MKTKKEDIQRHPSTIHFYRFLLFLKGNGIGEREAALLSEALKSNTTLTQLDLWSRDKRKKTQKEYINKPPYHFQLYQQVTTLETQEQHH